MLKKIIPATLVSFFLFSQAFAGQYDWTGKFTLMNSGSNKNTLVATHTPTYVTFGFIQVKSYHFSKGSSINGFVATADGVLSVDEDVNTFTTELSKLGGSIIDRQMS